MRCRSVASHTAPGGQATLLYQANLGTLNDASGIPVFLNGTGGNYFTFVAGFRETFSSISTSGGSTTATFSLASGAAQLLQHVPDLGTRRQPRRHRLHDRHAADVGHSQLGEFPSSFTEQTGTAPVTFDQFNTNNYPGRDDGDGHGGKPVQCHRHVVQPALLPELRAPPT